MKRTLEDYKYQENTKSLARFAKALGHPTRIAILKHLEKQSCCFTGDLVEVFPLAQSTISQHLKELKNSGLIQGTIDGLTVNYCLNPKAIDTLKASMNNFFSEIDYYNCC